MTQNKKTNIGLFKTEFERLKKVCDDDKVNGVEMIVKIILLSLRFLSAGIYVRYLGGQDSERRKNFFTDIYVLFKTLFAFIVVYAELYETGLQFIPGYIFVSMVIYFMVETLIYLSTTILSHNLFPTPISYVRATILGFLNYIEIVFTFSTLYAYTNSLQFSNNPEQVLSTLDYVYFSFITVSTIGYGNISVNDSLGKFIVIIQGLIFLVFCLVFLSYNISRIKE